MAKTLREIQEEEAARAAEAQRVAQEQASTLPPTLQSAGTPSAWAKIASAGQGQSAPPGWAPPSHVREELKAVVSPAAAGAVKGTTLG